MRTALVTSVIGIVIWWGGRAAEPAAPDADPTRRFTPVHVPKDAGWIRAAEPFHWARLDDLETEHGLTHKDRFRLSVKTAAGDVARMSLLASYGNVTVDVMPAFTDGEALLCLKVGHGRGTNVHAETLALFRLDADGWRRIAWLRLSWWDFDGNRAEGRRMLWHNYRWTLADRDGDGNAEVRLTPDHRSDAAREPLTYRWNAEAGRFIAPKGAPSADPKPDEMWQSLGWVIGGEER